MYKYIDKIFCYNSQVHVTRVSIFCISFGELAQVSILDFLTELGERNILPLNFVMEKQLHWFLYDLIKQPPKMVDFLYPFLPIIINSRIL